MTYPKDQTETIHFQTFAYLLVEEKEQVLHITLNRPEKKNAMNEVLVNELAYALSYAHHHNHIWSVVLAAKGDIWCAGADLKAFMGQKDTESGSSIPEPNEKVIIGDLFRNLHKPCIAKIHTPVMAGGFLLICGCTQVVASEKATFGLPEVKRGIWPMQVMASMLEIMPARTVLDFCMKGKTVDAKTAHELGVVTDFVAENELDEHVDKLVREICNNSPSAIRLGLKAFQEMKAKSDNEKHQYLHEMLMQVIQTKDAMEGIAAFKEKRKPTWSGE